MNHGRVAVAPRLAWMRGELRHRRRGRGAPIAGHTCVMVSLRGFTPVAQRPEEVPAKKNTGRRARDERWIADAAAVNGSGTWLRGMGRGRMAGEGRASMLSSPARLALQAA